MEIDIFNILDKHTTNVGLTEQAVLDAMRECLSLKRSQEWITSAAVMHEGLVIQGYRHSNCYFLIERFFGVKVNDIKEEDKGFITSINRFVGREEAYHIANKAGQLILKDCPDCEKKLISENIYWGSKEDYDS